MKQIYIIYLIGTYGELDWAYCAVPSEELARKFIKHKKEMYPELNYRYEPMDFYDGEE